MIIDFKYNINEEVITNFSKLLCSGQKGIIKEISYDGNEKRYFIVFGEKNICESKYKFWVNENEII